MFKFPDRTMVKETGLNDADRVPMSNGCTNHIGVIFFYPV